MREQRRRPFQVGNRLLLQRRRIERHRNALVAGHFTDEDLRHVDLRQEFAEELARLVEQRGGELPGQVAAADAGAVQAAAGGEDQIVQLLVEQQPVVGVQLLQETQRRLFEILGALRQHDAGGRRLADRLPKGVDRRQRRPRHREIGGRPRIGEVVFGIGRALIEVLLEMAQPLAAEAEVAHAVGQSAGEDRETVAGRHGQLLPEPGVRERRQHVEEAPQLPAARPAAEKQKAAAADATLVGRRLDETECLQHLLRLLAEVGVELLRRRGEVALQLRHRRFRGGEAGAGKLSSSMASWLTRWSQSSASFWAAVMSTRASRDFRHSFSSVSPSPTVPTQSRTRLRACLAQLAGSACARA